MISQTYDLNLIPSQIPVTIHCSQYDDGSRTFVFNLYEGASAFEIPAGASATFSGVKPDGLGFQYACSITGASQVSVDVELQMTAVAGDCPCKVTIYDTDSNVLGSALCVLDVERHPLQDDTVISDSDIPLVQEAVNWAAQFQPSDFVARNQGVAQAGKVLGIGADGMVTPVQGGGGGSADTVTYDNTSSGLDAGNVQDAIDEVDSAVDGLESQVSTLIGDTANYYNITDSADTTVDDADYVPFYDTSATAKKKITWSNIVTKIKSSLANYFGRKFSQSNGKLSLLTDNNTVLDSVTLSPLATNTSYTDTNSIGATNVQSAVDKLFSTFSSKFYYEHSDNLSTSGTWGDYNKKYINFNLPPEVIGVGKTFMLVHNVSLHQPTTLTMESKISLYGMNGTVYNNLYASQMGAFGWPSLTHIAFITCDVNPRFEIGLCTNTAVSSIYSNYILVPLN